MIAFDEALLQVFHDKLSGSVAVLQQLIRAILSFLIREKDPSRDLLIITERLPMMQKSLRHFAVVEHFLGELEKKVLELEHNNSDQGQLFDFVKDYDDHWKNANKLVAERAYETLNCKGKTILLLSNSSVITSFFSLLNQKGIEANIIQTESRPENEGRYQAEMLANLGFTVKFVVDSAAGFMMNHADFVMTGADQIRKGYFVNKIGSYALALLAREFNKPFYILADSRKISDTETDPSDLELIRRPSSDVWKTSNPKIHPVNYYFEAVPDRLITAVITEKSVVRYSS